MKDIDKLLAFNKKLIIRKMIQKGGIHFLVNQNGDFPNSFLDLYTLLKD